MRLSPPNITSSKGLLDPPSIHENYFATFMPSSLTRKAQRSAVSSIGGSALLGRAWQVQQSNRRDPEFEDPNGKKASPANIQSSALRIALRLLISRHRARRTTYKTRTNIHRNTQRGWWHSCFKGAA